MKEKKDVSGQRSDADDFFVDVGGLAVFDGVDWMAYCQVRDADFEVLEWCEWKSRKRSSN